VTPAEHISTKAGAIPAMRTFGLSWDEAFSPEFIAKAISASAIPLESKSEVLEVAI